MLYCYLFGLFYRLTLHKGAICMEKTVYRSIAEFPLSSRSSVYSVIEILFIAIAPNQSLWETEGMYVFAVLEDMQKYTFNHMLQQMF